MMIDSEQKIIWWGAVIVCYLLACLAMLVVVAIEGAIAYGVIKVMF